MLSKHIISALIPYMGGLFFFPPGIDWRILQIGRRLPV
jgi:hypothetical protein